MMNNDQLNLILRAYVVCALWSSTDEEGEPLARGRDADDIAPETMASMREDVSDFVGLLEREGVEWSAHWGADEFGHDLWLTRNGHGAGFWDRASVNDDDKYALGQTLTKWAETMGSVDLYVGDDGRVHAG